jgi:hypothetical protein
MNTLISTFHFWLHKYTARLSNVLNVKGDQLYVQSEDNTEEQTCWLTPYYKD